MTTATLDAHPVPDTPDHTVDRVSELLLRLERGDPRRLTLRPLADMRVTADDAIVFCTVFIDAGDGAGPQPFALNEVWLAADCLAVDPPFPAAPCLASRLGDAAVLAASAASSLQRSLS